MAGRHRRPLSAVIAEGLLYLALACVALSCIAAIVIGLGGWRP